MKVELRKWTPDDREDLVNICNNVPRDYLSNRMPYPYTLENTDWWLGKACELEGRDGVFRAIVVDGEISGNISVEKKADVYSKDAELGYCLMTENWSKGIMTEAAGQICRIAFEALDIIRITGLVYGPNIASRRVLEKNGFTLEGIMKNAVVKNENVYDLYVYGKLK